MKQHSRRARERKWWDSSHASLCLLGSYLRRTGFFQPLEEQVRLQQKVRQYTPVQKLEMVFVSLLAGAKAVAHSGTPLRVDPALQAAFGLPGCADQSVLADTLDAATAADVAALRRVVETSWQTHSLTRQHNFAGALLILDLDLSPLPASRRAEGSERGYMGRYRSKTGRKLVRVRAAATQETLWEEVVPGRTVETLGVVQQAVAAVERLLGLEEEPAEAAAQRARIEWRLDSGWGSEETINWLLARGYQVTGKFKAYSRVQKLVRPITAWEPTASPGREVAAVPEPVPLARPCPQYAVRTPSKDKPGGYYHAVLFTSRSDLGMQAVVTHYDARAGMEADLKGDKRGLGLGVIRKQKLPAQQMVVLLGQWAHNVLLWARRWLARRAPRLEQFGIVRLVQQVCAVPGRIKLTAYGISRVRLRPEHPCARDVYRGLRPLCPSSHTLGFLG
ncbi:MAG: transposase [Chloroflexota bacterium]|nr:transposase [Chloroflexota bacterium]